MSTPRIIQCICLASLTSVAEIEIRAEPMLLMEIVQRGEHPGTGAIPTTLMEFTVGDASVGPNIRIVGQYTVADIGSVFEVDRPTLDAGQAVLRSPTAGVGIYTFGYVGSVIGELLDSLWSYPPGHWTTVTAMVPRLGPSFSGYGITGITQTVDDIQWNQTCGTTCQWYGSAQQTIRIYGEALSVPEPSTLLLALIALWLFHHSTRPHQPVKKGSELFK